MRTPLFIAATIALSSITHGALALADNSAQPDSGRSCPQPSPEAATFLDKVIADMMDPDSGFTHQAILGSPEIKEIQEVEAELRRTDWGNVCQYQDANETVKQGPAPSVVFIGDSITQFWSAGDPDLFKPGLFKSDVINRGISGQTSSQMLVRFWSDVVALHPKAVHIMAGTNDLAENTGYVSDETFKNNIRSMTTLAQSNGIAVILASIPPADSFGWRPDAQPDRRIPVLNAWLEEYAGETGAIFVDYHRLLSDDGSAMSMTFTHDGLHPNRLGYAEIRPATTSAIASALARTE